MDKPNNAKILPNNSTKNLKIVTAASKNKKQLLKSSSKNIKILKSVSSKGQLNAQSMKLKQQTSPQHMNRGLAENDYGVNPYYAKYKVKTNRKKQNDDLHQSTDYGNFTSSRDTLNISQFEAKADRRIREEEESDYVSSAFQKFKLPNPRGLINEQGKFVTSNKQIQLDNYSLREKSISKNSFSLNFTKDKSRRKSKKSKTKDFMKSNKSLQYKLKFKSAEKTFIKEHRSFYEQSKKQQKVTKRILKMQQITKITSNNSKTSQSYNISTYSILSLTSDLNEIKAEIIKEVQQTKITIRKQKTNQIQQKERKRSINLLAKICGSLAIKRQSFALAVSYIDQYIGQFSYTSLKLVALSCLTLALKMDDAEMISKFCIQYIYNPQRTVKKTSSVSSLKLKNKPKQQTRQPKGKLTLILSSRISEQKKGIKQDFALQQILDFETNIMVKLGFKLMTKTVIYWIDLFTALWDGYVKEYCPQYYQALQFRDQKFSRNWCYLNQLIQMQSYTMTNYNISKVSLILGGLYLVARMALQQKKQETPWQELCRYYRASLSKSTNIIFCDGVGINPIFGDFLNLFDLGMSNIIDCVQSLSRYLNPQLIKVFNYRKLQGFNRQDRLSIYLYNDQLYK